MNDKTVAGSSKDEVAAYMAHLAGCFRSSIKSGTRSMTMIMERDAKMLQAAADMLGTAHETPVLPKLEFAEHCACCTRNKITVEVFGRPAQETNADPNGPPRELLPLLREAVKALDAGVPIQPTSFVHEELKRLLPARPAVKASASRELAKDEEKASDSAVHTGPDGHAMHEGPRSSCTVCPEGEQASEPRPLEANEALRDSLFAGDQLLNAMDTWKVSSNNDLEAGSDMMGALLELILVTINNKLRHVGFTEEQLIHGASK